MGSLITKEYQGMPFVFREDGYFNMTKAAEKFDRRVNDFLSLESTAEYLAALEALNTGKTGIWVETRRGNGGGTWAHPKLAVRFAQWLDVRFAVWCDSIIEDILTKKAELTITQPETSATVQVSQDPALRLAIQQLAQGFLFADQRVGAVEQRLEAVEKDVAFSSELVTINDFFKTYGISIRAEARHGIQTVLTKRIKDRGIAARTKQVGFHDGHPVTKNVYPVKELVSLWKDIRHTEAITSRVYRDTNLI